MTAVAAATRVVDASVHPVVRASDDLREYMPEPWRSRSFPGPERYEFAWTTGEQLTEAEREDGLAGSDADLLTAWLRAAGVDTAILLPLTRGLLPNVDLATAICAATNEWLAEWMDERDDDIRYFGSIRVNPSDPDGAVREIERWAGHERMVQVAVPTQAHAPYGHRSFFPIWNAAHRHGLPVALHLDGGASVDFPPTPVGYPRLPIEFATLAPLTAAFHLASLFAEGVFTRLEGLRFVFADGGLDSLTSIVWRLDKDWRATRDEIPWTTTMPSAAVAEHVRFVWNALDSSPPAHTARWLKATNAGSLLLFGTNYPSWDASGPGPLAGLEQSVRERVLFRNAVDLYGLEARR